MEWFVEQDAANNGEPIDVVISCEERDAMPDSWEIRVRNDLRR
jgi:hypothetical protein